MGRGWVVVQTEGAGGSGHNSRARANSPGQWYNAAAGQPVQSNVAERVVGECNTRAQPQKRSGVSQAAKLAFATAGPCNNPSCCRWPRRAAAPRGRLQPQAASCAHQQQTHGLSCGLRHQQQQSARMIGQSMQVACQKPRASAVLGARVASSTEGGNPQGPQPPHFAPIRSVVVHPAVVVRRTRLARPPALLLLVKSIRPACSGNGWVECGWSGSRVAAAWSMGPRWVRLPRTSQQAGSAGLLQPLSIALERGAPGSQPHRQGCLNSVNASNTVDGPRPANKPISPPPMQQAHLPPAHPTGSSAPNPSNRLICPSTHMARSRSCRRASGAAAGTGLHPEGQHKHAIGKEERRSVQPGELRAEQPAVWPTSGIPAAGPARRHGVLLPSPSLRHSGSACSALALASSCWRGGRPIQQVGLACEPNAAERVLGVQSSHKTHACTECSTAPQPAHRSRPPRPSRSPIPSTDRQAAPRKQCSTTPRKQCPITPRKQCPITTRKQCPSLPAQRSRPPGPHAPPPPAPAARQARTRLCHPWPGRTWRPCSDLRLAQGCIETGGYSAVAPWRLRPGKALCSGLPEGRQRLGRHQCQSPAKSAPQPTGKPTPATNR